MSRLLTTAEMRAADAAAIAAGVSGYTLMNRAGEAVAKHAAAMKRADGRIVVLCGPGNNGGDGFVAARLLREQGHRVEVALLGAKADLRGDAASAAADWPGPIVRPDESDLGGAELLIDALFGAGLSRDLAGEARALVERMNASGRPILAVDIPSGVDGDTGAVRGAAVTASATITFARRKPGHLLLPGRTLCGAILVADIGILDSVLESVAGQTFANSPSLWGELFPAPSLDTHKYKRGHALVVCGDALHTGAARLAARAALRTGAGLVTLASPSEALAVNAAHLTAIMLRRCDGPADLAALLADRRFNVAALGPALGVGPRTCNAVEAVLTAGRAAVLDADALTSFEGRAADLAGLATHGPWPVLTPHTGEFERLFAGQRAIVGAQSKLARARQAAAFVNGVVVLKGPDTVIAAPDGRAAINENATPYLATAGSGDVLTGIIAGLLAQGMPPFEAACAGVWLHAEAGRRFGPGLIAEDLPEALPGALQDLLTSLGLV